MKNHFKWQFILLILLTTLDSISAQEKAPPAPRPDVRRVVLPEILQDNSVRFRIYAPDAKLVQISMDRMYDMEHDTSGLWMLTTEPKLPGFYFYSLVVNGISFPYPSSPTFYEGNKITSGLEIPEPGIDFYDFKNVPHGNIRTHWYFSQQAGTYRRMFVYTPPGYNENTDKMYPVLYIHHGAGENERAWRDQGKTDMILDNLIAEGKAVPMLVVMPNEYVINDIGEGYNSESTNSYFDLYKDELKNDIIPFIEKNYRAIPDKNYRAITGLSMGGGISFRIGMRNTDTFGWVGVFSTSLFRGKNGEIFDADKQAPGVFTNPDKYNNDLKLLYISNGDKDPSFDYSVKSVQAFREAGLKLEFITFPGVHEWKVWRKALHDFAPRLFH